MKRYFLVAKEVGALTRVLCAKLEADQAKRAPHGLQRCLRRRRTAIRPSMCRGFRVEAGRLDVEAPAVSRQAGQSACACSRSPDARNLDVHPYALGEVGAARARHDARHGATTDDARAVVPQRR